MHHLLWSSILVNFPLHLRIKEFFTSCNLTQFRFSWQEWKWQGRCVALLNLWSTFHKIPVDKISHDKLIHSVVQRKPMAPEHNNRTGYYSAFTETARWTIKSSRKNKRRHHRNLPYSETIWRVSFKQPRQYSNPTRYIFTSDTPTRMYFQNQPTTP